MELFFGIDVGKFILDIHVNPLNQIFSVNNDQTGIKKLLKKINNYTKSEHCTKLIVCEATGGYENLLVDLLRDQNIPIHVAHANKVRNFAKATGKFAKTDKIDANILSDYAMVFKPKPNAYVIDKELKALKDLQIRRRHLMDDLIKEQNRLDKNIDKELAKSINRHIKWLKQEIKLVDRKIDAFILEHKDIKAQIDLITSIPGVGQITASAILTNLPEIKSVDNKQLSALIGVAPMNKDSGTKSGKRRIIGGRANVRNSLYMAAVASIRSNHMISKFYKRLRDKGKPAKVAIVAAMHKLLFIIKSVLKRQTVWIEYHEF